MDDNILNIKPGDYIKYKADYLKTISWSDNAPRYGKVIRIKNNTCYVSWSDKHEGKININYIEPYTGEF